MTLLSILFHLTLLIATPAWSAMVENCHVNSITLKNPITGKDIVNSTFCGPLQTPSLSTLPIIETKNVFHNVRNYTVLVNGPHGMDFLAVNCSFVGKTINIHSATILKHYIAPSRPGRYMISIYTQNGSRIDTSSSTVSALEWLHNQRGVVLQQANATSYYVVNSTKSIAPYYPGGQRGFAYPETYHNTRGAASGIEVGLFLLASATLLTARLY